MYPALLRAVRLVVSPEDEWRAIRDEEPRVRALIALFLLPLAVIPAAGWGLGMLLFGNGLEVGRAGAVWGFEQTVRGGLTAYAGIVLSVGLDAVAIALLAPLFGGLRDWPRALEVAAYSSAPVLLGGFVLIWPDLVFALILAFFYGLYLQYAGLQHVLTVKERDAAEYVALSTVLLIVLSTATGALGAWLGVL